MLLDENHPFINNRFITFFLNILTILFKFQKNPVQNLLDLQIAKNGLCGAFWIGVFVLLKTTKIGCRRFVAARGADLRSLCRLLVLALAVGEIRLVPVDVFLCGDYAVGTVVVLG